MSQRVKDNPVSFTDLEKPGDSPGADDKLNTLQDRCSDIKDVKLYDPNPQN